MRLTPLTCPECGGVIMKPEEVEADYECQIGHRYSVEGFRELQSKQVETALWQAFRFLNERRVLLEEYAGFVKKTDPARAENYRRHAEETSKNAERLKSVIERELGIMADEQIDVESE